MGFVCPACELWASEVKSESESEMSNFTFSCRPCRALHLRLLLSGPLLGPICGTICTRRLREKSPQRAAIKLLLFFSPSLFCPSQSSISDHSRALASLCGLLGAHLPLVGLHWRPSMSPADSPSPFGRRPCSQFRPVGARGRWWAPGARPGRLFLLGAALEWRGSGRGATHARVLVWRALLPLAHKQRLHRTDCGPQTSSGRARVNVC